MEPDDCDFYRLFDAMMFEPSKAKAMICDEPSLVGATNRSNETVIHWFVVENDIEKVKFLHECGAPIDSHALTEACSLGYLDMCELLLCYGKQISSKYLFFTKKIFPLLWFGFLASFVFQALMNGTYEKDLMFLVVPCIMAVFGFFLMKKIVWDLVDDVYDCGDSLLIKGRGVEERVPLANIMNVSASTNMNPPRITLRLVQPGKLGSEISFSPATPFTLNPFAKNPVAEDLIVRVDAARAKRAL
jgi:ankyrin repeat protein